MPEVFLPLRTLAGAIHPASLGVDQEIRLYFGQSGADPYPLWASDMNLQMVVSLPGRPRVDAASVKLAKQWASWQGNGLAKQRGKKFGGNKPEIIIVEEMKPEFENDGKE